MQCIDSIYVMQFHLIKTCTRVSALVLLYVRKAFSIMCFRLKEGGMVPDPNSFGPGGLDGLEVSGSSQNAILFAVRERIENGMTGRGSIGFEI